MPNTFERAPIAKYVTYVIYSKKIQISVSQSSLVLERRDGYSSEDND